MNLLRVTYCCILQVVLLGSLTAASNKNDHYLLSCGAPSTVDNMTSGNDGQTWESDDDNAYSDDFSSTIPASTATTFNAPRIPFFRARIFSSNFTYNFRVTPGPKFIRLFFYPSPSTYNSPFLTLSAADAYLTVQVNSGQLLLRNFSAYLSSRAASSFYIFKEFYVHINVSLLQLTFSPTSCPYAFINGIEVVSVPENLYVRPSSTPRSVAAPSTRFDIGISTTLETAYRLNVGGAEVSPVEDSGSMYRNWVSDDRYLIGNITGTTGFSETSIKYTKATSYYSAPAVVYETFRSMGGLTNKLKTKVNLTWGFEVDLGFYYMVRLHWCELVEINSSNYRVFDVFIDDQIADEAIDIFEMIGSQTPTYRDYVVYMDGRDGSRVLQLAMHPHIESHPRYHDVLLNALEIFKINGSRDSHVRTNSHIPSISNFPSKQVSTNPSRKSKLLHAIIFGAIGSIILTSILACVVVFRRKSRIKQSSRSGTCIKTKSLAMSFEMECKTSEATSFASPCHVCHRFSLAQIKLATNDFNEELIIGRGGFGNVYRGMLHGENGLLYKAAIKRLNPSSKQGANEFNTEIEMLSKIRHLHLVSLIGYCDEIGEMILVYDYMENGTLRDHIYNTNNPPLSWNLRLNICLGAAKGLHYLHSGVGQMIIHRDVKSTNILLDENWVPKVADFGLSKLGPIGGHLHVSTAVKGSFGYMDPEYYMLQQLTEKSDVYSFGVVLFEVLCGRAAVNPNLPFEEVNVAIWARNFQRRGAIDLIIDPLIKGEIVPACLRRFGEIAERCVREHRTERPTMADVVWSLDLAIELQNQGDIMSRGNISSDNGLPLFLSQSTSLDELRLRPSPTSVSTSHREGETMTDI